MLLRSGKNVLLNENIPAKQEIINKLQVKNLKKVQRQLRKESNKQNNFRLNLCNHRRWKNRCRKTIDFHNRF